MLLEDHEIPDLGPDCNTNQNCQDSLSDLATSVTQEHPYLSLQDLTRK